MVKVSKTKLSRSDWLEAALQALAKDGPDSLKILPLAASIGASRGSFYWHFRDRQDLLGNILTYWEAELTDTVIALGDSTEDNAQKCLLNVLNDVLLHDKGHYEPAIRAWALHDPHVAKTVRRVDRKRIAFITTLFRKMGFSPQESEARGRLAYVYLIGDAALLEREPRAKLQKYIRMRHRILTAR
jgi:AcrR family transcriptional regulator